MLNYVYNPFSPTGQQQNPNMMTITGAPAAAPAMATLPAMSTQPAQPVVPFAQQPVAVPAQQFTPANVAATTMNQITDAGGAYMSNARRRGLEFAAARKLGNSSVAAGASERSALEAAQPLFGEAMGLHKQRENTAFEGEQAQLNRNQQYTMAQVQDWLGSRQFNREFNGALSMMPINSAYQLNGLIQTYALDNPEVYTQDVISGMSNFFAQNFQQILSSYFPQYGGGP